MYHLMRFCWKKLKIIKQSQLRLQTFDKLVKLAALLPAQLVLSLGADGFKSMSTTKTIYNTIIYLIPLRYYYTLNSIIL